MTNAKQVFPLPGRLQFKDINILYYAIPDFHCLVDHRTWFICHCKTPDTHVYSNISINCELNILSSMDPREQAGNIVTFVFWMVFVILIIIILSLFALQTNQI